MITSSTATHAHKIRLSMGTALVEVYYDSDGILHGVSFAVGDNPANVYIPNHRRPPRNAPKQAEIIKVSQAELETKLLACIRTVAFR